GENFTKIKEYKKALQWLNEAEKLNDGIAAIQISEVYEKLANRYARAHNYKEALKLYEKALNVRDKKLQNKIDKIKKLLDHQSKLTEDTRKAVTKSSPPWTHAVGRLIIPTKLQFINEKQYTTKNKKCSATLVNLAPNTDSSIIVTASHCLTQYDKTAGPLKFIIQNNKKIMIYRIANIEFDSKFQIKKMKTTTDFAILSLHEPISTDDVKAMVIQKKSFADLQTRTVKNFGSLAGFSGDIAQYGEKLTYDPNCRLKSYNSMYGASTCSGFNGASGGPIVLTTTNDDKNFKYYYVGVVSHFRNKNYKNIYFAPHHIFYDRLEKIIRDFN
ncbi:MAG: trypsin-like serine protease, partial [Arcobacteraceae bacterium]